MRVSDTRPVVAARFDEPNLVSAAGLVPVMRLARAAGLDTLAGELLSVATDKGANAGGEAAPVGARLAAGGRTRGRTAPARAVGERPGVPAAIAPARAGAV